ncbi:MAG TPA: hypothetical protein VE176_11345, partial [Candidatus Limnocylindrales bacterium]|nr:hypothetical protein [Candidatus Limnocylindrales bacterium]
SGDRTVEAFFCGFSALQIGPISACFFRFHCSVGRGSQRFVQSPMQKIYSKPSGQLPFANCQLL